MRFAVGAAELVEGRMTQKVVDRFRPLVKESISAAILEIVGQSFTATATAEMEQPEDATPEEGDVAPVSRIVTTEEELRLRELVAHMLAPHVPDPSKLKHQDTQRYFALQYAKTTGWFVRYILQGDGKRFLSFRLPETRVRELVEGFEVDGPSWMGDSRVQIGSVEDAARLENLFVAAVREVVS